MQKWVGGKNEASQKLRKSDELKRCIFAVNLFQNDTRPTSQLPESDSRYFEQEGNQGVEEIHPHQ